MEVPLQPMAKHLRFLPFSNLIHKLVGLNLISLTRWEHEEDGRCEAPHLQASVKKHILLKLGTN